MGITINFMRITINYMGITCQKVLFQKCVSKGAFSKVRFSHSVMGISDLGMRITDLVMGITIKLLRITHQLMGITEQLMRITMNSANHRSCHEKSYALSILEEKSNNKKNLDLNSTVNHEDQEKSCYYFSLRVEDGSAPLMGISHSVLRISN
jgi:hypothetical protein